MAPYVFCIIFCSFFRRAEWLRILNVKLSVKRLYACSLHFSPEYIFGNRVSKFDIPKCAQLHELSKENTIPSFSNFVEVGKSFEIIIGNQDKILEDITMDNEMSCSFRETPSYSESVLHKKRNLDVRILKAALDRCRRQYLLEKRLKNKLKIANAILSYLGKLQNIRQRLQTWNWS